MKVGSIKEFIICKRVCKQFMEGYREQVQPIQRFYDTIDVYGTWIDRFSLEQQTAIREAIQGISCYLMERVSFRNAVDPCVGKEVTIDAVRGLAPYLEKFYSICDKKE